MKSLPLSGIGGDRIGGWLLRYDERRDATVVLVALTVHTIFAQLRPADPTDLDRSSVDDEQGLKTDATVSKTDGTILCRGL